MYLFDTVLPSWSGSRTLGTKYISIRFKIYKSVDVVVQNSNVNVNVNVNVDL